MKILWHWEYMKNLQNLPRTPSGLLQMTEVALISIHFGSESRIDKLPDEFTMLSNLKYLEMGSASMPELYATRLTELPENLGLMKNLESLYIQNNYLTSLPGSIGLLENLNVLKLGGNNLKSLPDEIGFLQNLEKLTVWKNQISELPATIGNLRGLKYFSLWGNPIEKLPDEIMKLTNLKSIELYCMPTLTLTKENVDWLKYLKENGCDIGGDRNLEAMIASHVAWDGQLSLGL